MNTNKIERYRYNFYTKTEEHIKPHFTMILLEKLGEISRGVLTFVLFCATFLGMIALVQNAFAEDTYSLENYSLEGLSFNTGRIDQQIKHLEVPNMRPYRRLALAVGKHETAGCTKGWGVLYNNCVGKMVRGSNGKLVPARFATKEESYLDFEEFWGRMYGHTEPTMQDAIRYSGNDRANHWYANVTHFLNTL